MMPNLDILPAEVVLTIFEHVDRRDLRALRLVASAFSWAASRLLFTRLYVSSHHPSLYDDLPRHNGIRPLMRDLEFDGSDHTLYHDLKADIRLRPRGVRKFLRNLSEFDDVDIRAVRLRQGTLCLVPLLKCFAEYGITSIRHVSLLCAQTGETPVRSTRKKGGRSHGDEKLVNLLSELQDFELATNFSHGGDLTRWLEKMPNLQKLHLTTCYTYLRGRFALWSFMNTVHHRPIAYGRLRAFTLTVHTLLSCFLGSQLIHQPSVEDITLLNVNLRPTHHNPYRRLDLLSGFTWDYDRWQNFIDAFQKAYGNSRKRLTVGMLAECKVLVEVRTVNPQVVKILSEEEVSARTGQWFND
jgi:hypothetical protein